MRRTNLLMVVSHTTEQIETIGTNYKGRGDKMSFKHSFVLFAVLGLLVATDDVLADGYQFLPGGKYRPSNETLGRVDTAQFGGSCYLIGTQTPINCHFDFKVLGLADVYNSAPYNAPIGWSSILTAGGHTSDHTDLADHPLFYRESPYVTFSNGVTTASEKKKGTLPFSRRA